MPNLGEIPGPCFLGRFVHTLDDKRRISIPKAFREDLGTAFYLVPSLDPCLWLLTEKRFEALRSSLKAMQEPGFGVGDSKVREFRREIFSRSTKLSLDKQGRIALPVELGKSVGIDKDVVFLGVDEKVELWSPAAEQLRDDPERLRRLSKELIG